VIFFLPICLLLYLYSAYRIPIGILYDDADYILMAKSLLMGKLVILSHPLEHSASYHSPGLSFLLAPLVFLFQPHWDLLKILPLLSTLATLVIIYSFFGHYLDKKNLYALLVCFALNRATVISSASVMTESIFVFLMLSAFFITYQLIQEENLISTNKFWILALILFYLPLLRPEGLFVSLSILLIFIITQKINFLLKTISAIIFSFLTQHLIGKLIKNNQATYSHALISQWNFIRDNKIFYLKTQISNVFFDIFTGGLAGQLWSENKLEIVFKTLFGLATFIICILGWRSLRDKKRDPVVLYGMSSFLLLYIVLHFIWPAVEIRLFQIIFPILFLYFFSFFEGPSKAKQWISFFFICLLLSSNAYSLKSLFFNEKIISNKQSFLWIQKNTPTNALFISESPQLLYLRTNRQGFTSTVMCQLSNTDEFAIELSKSHINYIVFAETGVMSTNLPDQLSCLERMNRLKKNISHYPYFFQIYTNQDEGISVYKLNLSSNVAQAYALYSQSKIEKSLSMSLVDLKKSVQLADNWPRGLVAYGFVLYQKTKKLEDSMPYFLKALSVNPNYHYAFLNLARIYKEQGQLEKSFLFYQKAKLSIEDSMEDMNLLNVIEQETPIPKRA